MLLVDCIVAFRLSEARSWGASAACGPRSLVSPTSCARRSAAKGKQYQRHVARCLVERERLLLDLQHELLSQRYRPGRMTSFVIHDRRSS